jgi:galactokinase
MKKFWAPGRVNLIGEHLDYNGGMVLPCPLAIGTHLEVEIRDDRKLVFSSENFDGKFTFDLDAFPKSEESWCRYPLGVFNEFLKLGFKMGGMDLHYRGEIPQGAGLSSSASIEVVTAKAINDIFKLGLTPLDMVKLSQRAENDYVGVACGIMDQFAIGMGEKEKAVAINCENLDYEVVDIHIPGHKFIVANTNHPRSLGEGFFNQRRLECEKAFENRSITDDISDLDGVYLKRARHVVSENKRVLDFLEALKIGDVKKLGALLNESHNSLKEDFEVTGEHLDTLVELSQSMDFVKGSRMTGAGFGGCTVNLVDRDKIIDYCDQVGTLYEKHFGIKPEFYEV